MYFRKMSYDKANNFCEPLCATPCHGAYGIIAIAMPKSLGKESCFHLVKMSVKFGNFLFDKMKIEAKLRNKIKFSKNLT